MWGALLGFVSSTLTTSPLDRLWLGPAVEPQLPGVVWRAEISRSPEARRALAWQLFYEVARETKPGLPLWMTWYTGEEVGGLTHELLRAQGPPEKALPGLLQTSWDGLRAGMEPRVLEAHLASLSPDRGGMFVYPMPQLERTLLNGTLTQRIVDQRNNIASCIAPGAPGTEGCFSPAADPRGPRSLAVKAVWMPLQGAGGKPGIPVHDTRWKSIEALEEGTWATKLHKPEAQGALLAERGGETFALVGLHLMWRIDRDWFWATLWWSGSGPTDFADDRPKDWSLAGRASQYALCTVSAFEGEEAIDPRTTRSWCSNPYVELGKSNAKTNCIGCHQHAGPGGPSPDEILASEEFHRRRRVTVSPADYLWSMTQGRAGGWGPRVREAVELHER